MSATTVATVSTTEMSAMCAAPCERKGLSMRRSEGKCRRGWDAHRIAATAGIRERSVVAHPTVEVGSVQAAVENESVAVAIMRLRLCEADKHQCCSGSSQEKRARETHG